MKMLREIATIRWNALRGLYSKKVDGDQRAPQAR
jgi:hypothetical protein